MRVLSQLTLPNGNGEQLNVYDPLQGKFPNVGSVFNEIVTYVFLIGGIGLLIMILSAGFTLLTSAGDAKQMEKGKQTLTYAIVGFIIIFVAYWVVQLAGTIFGFQSIKTIFK